MTTPTLSLIIPVYNEKENLALLYRAIAELYKVLQPFEVICIDDGSVDGSLDELRSIAKRDARFKIISFARNYGQTAALGAGIKAATGDIIVALDADLQNDPADIPKLLARLEEGFDVVSGWRKDRHDGWGRVFVSRIANTLIARVTGVYLNDYGCTLKAYRASIVKNIDFVGEVHRLVPAYASWQGAKVTELVVNHHPRKFGVSKYGFNRIGKVLLDLLIVKYFISYAQKPMYFFGSLGVVSIFLGMLSFVGAVIMRFAYHVSLIQTPLLLLTALFVMIGFQFITMGIIADMLMRTRSDKNKTPYSIKETINF